MYLSIYSSIYKDTLLRSKDTTENPYFQAFLRLFFRLFPPYYIVVVVERSVYPYILYSSSSTALVLTVEKLGEV